MQFLRCGRVAIDSEPRIAPSCLAGMALLRRPGCRIPLFDSPASLPLFSLRSAHWFGQAAGTTAPFPPGCAYASALLAPSARTCCNVAIAAIGPSSHMLRRAPELQLGTRPVPSGFLSVSWWGILTA